MIFLGFMTGVLLAVSYVCVVFKLGFWVSDQTSHTGFDLGFYMITVMGGLALPFAVLAEIYV